MGNLCVSNGGNFPDPDDWLNPYYIEPTGSNEPGYSVEIYLNDTPYEFNLFYNPPTMDIEENRGFERGVCKFRITDFDPDRFNLPFIPMIDMKVHIRNRTKNDDFFVGRIVEVEAKLIVRRCDGTEVMTYDVTCSDLTIDFERILVSERYVNVTTGFIARDLVRRFTFFDYSQIDPTAGQVVTDMRFNLEFVAACIQRILELEPTWTFYYNVSTAQVYIGEIDTSASTIMTVTESNVYEVFDPPSFVLTHDTSMVHNRVYFTYNQRYAVGTVSIARGDVVVFGQGTQFTNFQAEGASIRFNGDDAVYSVQRVYSDTELWISSPYQEEAIITEAPYEIIGIQSTVVVSDPQSIAYMAQVNNETGPLAGIYEYKVPNDSNAYTRTEAIQIAKSHLLRWSSPLVTGEAKSYNSLIPLRSLHAGQAIRFILPVSRRVEADVVIQQLRKKDTGALLPRVDTTAGEDRIDPLMIYEFDFRDRIFDIRNQIKRLQIDIRRNSNDENVTVEHIQVVSEFICITDNTELVEPTVFASEELEISDSLEFKTPPAGPYYTTPTLQQAGHCIGVNNWGFTS